MQHIFSVDVEDWYNGFPPEYAKAVPHSPRLEFGMNFLLDTLDAFGIQATFFWVAQQAEAYPALLRETFARGHEIGCHSYDHTPIYFQNPKEFETSTEKTIAIISDTIGKDVHCYRAPYFSIRKDTYWAFDILASLGITHDSSILPMRHWRTGIQNASDCIHSILTGSGSITEVPITMTRIFGKKLPASGGGYFRAYPYTLTRRNFVKCQQQKKPAVFYIHPWELDSQQPRMKKHDLPNMMHYLGLDSAQKKIRRLLKEYPFGPLIKIADAELRDRTMDSSINILNTERIFV